MQVYVYESQISTTLRRGNPNSSYSHLHDRHDVVAEDVQHLHRQFVAAWRAFVGYAFEFQRAVFFHAETLPFVLEDGVAGILLFPYWQILLFIAHAFEDCLRISRKFSLDAGDLACALEVEIHAPVADPVRPVQGQRLAFHDAIFVLAHLHNPALFHHGPAVGFLVRREGYLSIGD